MEEQKVHVEKSSSGAASNGFLAGLGLAGGLTLGTVIIILVICGVCCLCFTVMAIFGSTSGSVRTNDFGNFSSTNSTINTIS